MGKAEEALSWCRQGLGRFADDPELLMQQGQLLWQTGEREQACGCLAAILEGRPGQYFASVDAGLRGFRTRHLLGEWYRQLGRLAEAEVQWRTAAAEQELRRRGWRWASCICSSAAGTNWKRWPAGWTGAVRSTRACCGRGAGGAEELTQARRLLEGIVGRAPEALGPRVVLSQVLLEEGRDLGAAERVLREVLALDPEHKETKHNLEVLLRIRRRQPAALVSA